VFVEADSELARNNSHGELLSYLLFDRDFIDALIDLGRADATRWLNAPPGPEQPWQTEPLDAFTAFRDGVASRECREHQVL
jgi:hypothetical protein